MSKTIDIVFGEGDGPMNMRFVEIEDGTGKSLSIGEWIKREDGYSALRIDRAMMQRFTADAPPAITLEEHTKAVAAFLGELGMTMGVIDVMEEMTGATLNVKDMCARLLERAKADRNEAEAWQALRFQLAQPQFLVCTHQGAVDPAKRYAEVKFKYHGAGALDLSASMHDALLEAARSVQPKPVPPAVDPELLRLAIARFGEDMRELDEQTILDRYAYEAAVPAPPFVGEGGLSMLKNFILAGKYRSASEA